MDDAMKKVLLAAQGGDYVKARDPLVAETVRRLDEVVAALTEEKEAALREGRVDPFGGRTDDLRAWGGYRQ